MGASNQSRNVQINIVGDSSKLSSAMKKGADDTQSATGRISGAWRGVASTLSGAMGGALGPIMGVFDKIGEGFDALREKGKTVGGVMMGIGATAAGVGAGLSVLGSKEKAADQQLAQAFTNAGKSVDDYSGQIDSAVGHMTKYGYTSGEVKDALAQLTTSTKDPVKALGLLQTAADLAATKHESLATATTQLNTIVAGRGTRTLQQLGITMTSTKQSAAALTTATNGVSKAQDAVAKAQQHLADLEAVDHAKKKLTIADQIALRNAHDAVTLAKKNLLAAQQKETTAQAAAKKASAGQVDALTAVANATKGQAAAASDTWTGKLKAVRAELENQVSTIGQKYGPAITAAGSAMAVLGGVTETVSGIISRFKGVDEAASLAEGVKTAAEGADTAAEAAEATGAAAADAASLPLILTVGLIVAAVAALGIGIYELATHWSQVMGAIEGFMVGAWHAIDNGFIHPIEHFFEGIPNFIKSHLALIATIIAGPFGLAVVLISQHISDILGFIEGIPNAISGFASTMWNGISDSFKDMIDFIIGLWNWIASKTEVTLPSVNVPLVGNVGGGTIGPLLPTLPMLAQGGIATSPTLAMIGDNPSGKEAIVPLEKAGQFGFGGGGDIVVPVELSIDGRTFARATARYTRDELLRGTARNARKTGLA